MCLILGLGLWVVKPLTDSYGLLGQLPPFKERRSPKGSTNKQACFNEGHNPT